MLIDDLPITELEHIITDLYNLLNIEKGKKNKRYDHRIFKGACDLFIYKVWFDSHTLSYLNDQNILYVLFFQTDTLFSVKYVLVS